MLLIFFLIFYPEADKAVGISDKGELSNVTSNFGLIANLHYFTPSFHWPNSAVFQQQYCPGFGVFAARNDTVIESFLNLAYPEWAPLAGSFGTLYSGEVTTADGTPVIATSDDMETWPWVNGVRTWPGPFRKDTTGQQVPGEFTSDQDLFCVFNDQSVFGLQVDQSVYSYGRIYAEDLIFYDFNIYSAQGAAIENVYLGFRGNFRCDYDMQDYIGLYRDSTLTFVYHWDADGIPQEPWESVGMIGVGFLHQPISNFHYYRKEDEPLDDFRLYPIIISDPTSPYIDPTLFFHGPDTFIDDPSLVQALPPESTSAYNYIVSAGPVTIPAGDTVQFSIVVVCGNDSADLFKNLETARLMAENNFVGSTAPAPPFVHAATGYRRVTLYWEAEPSESSVDMLTGIADFEGYKIYRSEDQGLTWGPPITDHTGAVVGYVPLAQFDLVDGIEGIDPAFPYQSLGDETGLKHSYVDTTVYNGIEYWYCVAAYDRGNQDPDSLEASYENPPGRPGVVNVVSAVAAGPPAGYDPAYVAEGDTLEPIGGLCEGLALVTIVDPAGVRAATYEITFNDTLINDSTVTTFNLLDRTLAAPAEPETLLSHHPLSDSSLDNIPIIDGFRLTLFNCGSGIKSMAWTQVAQDTCTFEWWTGYLGMMAGETYISGSSDFQVVVDHANPATVGIIDGFGGWHPPLDIPIRIYDITDTLDPVDVSDYGWLVDYRYAIDDSTMLGPAGWDLVPGGAGYNPNPGGVAGGLVDQIGCETPAGDAVYFATQNGPETATAPSEGDRFTIITFKPFRDVISYRFTTVPASIATEGIDLNLVKVVPNPYVLASKFESTPYDRRLMFTNLPEQCDIMIYNVAGEHITTIEHRTGLGYAYWDLRTKYGIEVAYGMYVFVVRTEDGAKANGKFVIIK